MIATNQIKLMCGNWLFHCQNGLGFYRLENRGKKPLAVLMYHGLESDPKRLAKSSHRVTPEGCLQEIQFFQRQGYQLIGAEEIEGLENRRGATSTGYLLVTFDDGHANIFPHVKEWMESKSIPVLLAICPGIVENNEIYWWEEVRARFDLMRDASIRIEIGDGTVLSFGKNEAQQFEEASRRSSNEELQQRLEQLRQATSYVSPEQLRASAFVHENMNWKQVIELAKHPLCTLASHSFDHEIATQLPVDEFRLLAQASLELLELRTGVRPKFYVYPNGMYSVETEKVLGELGIQHTFSTEGALNSIPSGTLLNRLNGYDVGNRGLRYYGALWRKRHSDFYRAAA